MQARKSLQTVGRSTQHKAQALLPALKINKPWKKAGGCMADPLDKTLSLQSTQEKQSVLLLVNCSRNPAGACGGKSSPCRDPPVQSKFFLVLFRRPGVGCKTQAKEKG